MYCKTSGRPGQGATVKIRGTGTFSKAGTDPLVLIDGLSGNIDDVDPNDIQSISFLKDAASASIYGNRAANGVVLVTTKKGALGKVKLSYNGYFGIQEATSLPSVLNSYDYATLYNELVAIQVSRKSIYRNKFRSLETELTQCIPVSIILMCIMIRLVCRIIV